MSESKGIIYMNRKFNMTEVARARRERFRAGYAYFFDALATSVILNFRFMYIIPLLSLIFVICFEPFVSIVYILRLV
jgi:hypothetical protein